MNSLPAGPREPAEPDPLAEQLVEQVKPFLRPDKMPQARQAMMAITRKIHQGPLPAPEDFEHYDAVLPGAAERIVAMAENEQMHRHSAEQRIITHEYVGKYVGQAGAVLALLALLATVLACAYMEQPIAAGVIASIGAIIIGFLKYSSMRAPEADAEPAPKRKQPQRRKK